MYFGTRRLRNGVRVIRKSMLTESVLTKFYCSSAIAEIPRKRVG